MSKKIMLVYITSSIPYANSKPHIGTCLDHVLVDTFYRFYSRFNSGGAKLTIGADQNGVKNFQKASQLGISTADFVKQNTLELRKMWDKLEINQDHFIETSSLHHQAICQIVWKKLVQKNLIYTKSYNSLYCVGCEEFKTKSSLTDGKCPIHPYQELQEISETNYFFKLSKFNEIVLDFLEVVDCKPKTIALEQKNFVKEGLEDLSISRDRSKLPWGVLVPENKDNLPQQTMYIWFEALLSYISAIVEPDLTQDWFENTEIRPVLEETIWSQIIETFPVDLMIMGSDNARFHLVVWPAILAALGLPLPKRAIVHGFINDDKGRKFSKSLGNSPDIDKLIDDLGVTAFRYWLLHEVNLDKDTSFDLQQLKNTYNTDLANTIGNLVQRLCVLADKFCPDLDFEFVPNKEILGKIENLNKSYELLDSLSPRESLDVILENCRWANEYLEKTKPWALGKEGKMQETKEIVHGLIILMIECGKALSIFLPELGAKIIEVLNKETIKIPKPILPKIEYEK